MMSDVPNRASDAGPESDEQDQAAREMHESAMEDMDREDFDE